MPALAMVMVCPSATVIGRQGPCEGVRNCGDRATAPFEDICHRAFRDLFCASWYTMAVRDVAHVERSGAGLRHGGRHHAGVSVDQQRRRNPGLNDKDNPVLRLRSGRFGQPPRNNGCFLV